MRRWLRSQGVQPAGQPFCKYNVIDMDRQLEVEAGFPVAAPVTGEGQVLAAVLPASTRPCCIPVTRTGWPAQPERCLTGPRSRAWPGTSRPRPDGEQWGCRLEIYHDEPGQDMSEWETELAFKLAD